MRRDGVQQRSIVWGLQAFIVLRRRSSWWAALLCKQEVAGSRPAGSMKNRLVIGTISAAWSRTSAEMFPRRVPQVPVGVPTCAVAIAQGGSGRVP